MAEEFLTRERIQRLHVMGIAVWQDRAKRTVGREEIDPVEHSGALQTVSEDVARESQKSDTSAQVPSPAVEAPRPDAAAMDWQQLRAAVSNCRACTLCDTRQQTVFGVGDQSARVMVIGEAPGAEEDRRGEPFVGRAGQLLDAMLLSVGLQRSDVFIANVLKCRPPANRDPHANEALQCSSYLQRQIALVQPEVLVAVGRIASQLLLDSNASLGRLRGKVHRYGDAQIPTVVTYHPAYLLRSPDQKRKAWEDLLMSQTLLKEGAT